MRCVTVGLGSRSYPICIGPGLLARHDLWPPYLKTRSAVIVSNDVVAPLYMAELKRTLAAEGVHAGEIVVPDGEQHKEWRTLNVIHDYLLERRAERSTTLIALGGGVVGDLAGFAAATYQRGVPFIQVPTTLLAQVDSSVGGKTAINHPLGKNMIGAFHQPRLVLADTDSLRTLPDRELRAGLAEVIKYGLIRDLPFFEWIEANLERLLSRDGEMLGAAIERSCINKAQVVEADETEAGVRATLNLGHTFGHAIEAGSGYGVWLHGEAVAAGTTMAAHLSQRLGSLTRDAVARIERLLLRAGLPVRGPALGVERYLDLMRRDKKVAEGRLRLVLLERIGHASIRDDAPLADIRAAIESCSADG